MSPPRRWCSTGLQRVSTRDLHDLPPVRRPRGRRAHGVLLDGHAQAVARARSELQGAARAGHRQGPGQPRASSSTRCCRPPTSRSCSPTRCPWAKTNCPHLELTREIVRRFNDTYGEYLVEPKAAHRQGGRARARHRRPQDVEELRQRHLHRRLARGDARQSHVVRDRPAAQAQDRSRRPRHLPASRRPQALRSRRRDRRVGRLLPQRRVRLRRPQEEARRGPHRVLCAVPGPPSRACGDPEPCLGRARRTARARRGRSPATSWRRAASWSASTRAPSARRTSSRATPTPPSVGAVVRFGWRDDTEPVL